jgi:D-alanyl-D-alanine carboxypeptidase
MLAWPCATDTASWETAPIFSSGSRPSTGSPCPARWHAITIADLLDHTSGIPDYLNDLAASWPPKPATPGQLIASFAAAPLHFAPGTRMRYSNSGYVLLGALIEHITGQTLAAFL